MLVVNGGEFESANFANSVRYLEGEYGYEGLAWDMVVASSDLEILAEFLTSDGLHAEVI